MHCSWMNQVEHWFSILQRRHLTAPNFDDLQDLERKSLEFILQWNVQAHPFRWSKRSFDKVLAKVDAQLAIAA